MTESRTFTRQGVECPDCGSSKTGVLNAGYDIMGTRIRARQCTKCEKRFGTAEVVLPDDFIFSDADVYKSEKDHEKYERLMGRRVPKAAARRGSDVVIVQGVRILKGQKSDWCRRGLHEMIGENVVVRRKDGHRLCRACRLASGRKYRAKNRDELNRRRRARKAVVRMTKQLQEPIAA